MIYTRSKRTPRIRTACLLTTCSLALAPGVCTAAAIDEKTLIAAAMSRDPEDIAAALTALEEAISRNDEAALRHAALLHIAYGSSSNLQLDRPVDMVKEHLERAVELIERLQEQDAATQETVLLRTYAMFMQVALDRSRAGEFLPTIQSGIQEAEAFDDESDALVFMQTLLLLAGRQPTPESLERLSVVAEQIAARAQDEGATPDWWDMQVFNLLGLSHTVFLGNPEEGRRWTTMGLAIRPDCQLLLDFHEPSTRQYKPAATSAIEGLAWKTIATDPAGDGDERAGIDATELAVASDANETLWLRISIEQWPGDGRVGFNLVIDADGDQETGTAWWGGTDTFTFDRIATLWVREAADGSFYGINGYTSDDSAFRMRMLDESVGDLQFVVDRDGGVLCVGLDPRNVADLAEASVIIAVGTNQWWGDDLTGPSAAPILLDLRE